MRNRFVLGLGSGIWIAAAQAAIHVQGQLVDTNGQPLAQTPIVLERDGAGARAITVFSDAQGRFAFPDALADTEAMTVPHARALGYNQVDAQRRVARDATRGDRIVWTLLARRNVNQSSTAPASAWLGRITDRAEKSRFILDCIDCHQVPGPEQRAYAAAIADVPVSDPHVARTESWKAIVRYMNYLSNWEFARGQAGGGAKLDYNAVYEITDGDRDIETLARVFDDRLDHLSGYQWGAPSIANANTVMREYEVDHPNAVREAVLLGEPRQLWMADVAANRLVAVDIASGAQRSFQVPSKLQMSPHSLHRDHDGSLWVTPLFNSTVAHLDVQSGQWKTWQLRTADGKSPGIHDLSFGYQHELLTDARGRIWYSDIGNNAVGYFDPRTGVAKIWPAPASPGRDGRTSMYGLVMTKDRKQVWYSQLGNGTIGGFDIEKEQYIGPFQLPDRNSGPRRITISDQDILYFALYGSGQLAEFDARNRKLIGLYDLPDTGSAPYTATWDPLRRVVWVGTSNGDVIYRFDPRSKQFGMLQLPRAQTFLRMIDIDPRTGVLVSAYANIVDIVQGPRMALIVDPGDGVYPEKFVPGGVASFTAATVRAANRPDAPPPGADGAKLVENARCGICHDLSQMSIGPPFKAIAARHAAQREVMVDVLARKIVQGGGGNWGLVPMVPNQWVTLDEARLMAAWILDLAGPPATSQ